VRKIFIVPSVGKTTIQIASFLMEASRELQVEAKLYKYNPNRLRGFPRKASEFLSKRRMFHQLKQFSPSIFLSIKADTVSPNLLHEIKAHFKMQLVNWWPDDPLLLEDSKNLSPFYDLFLTSNPPSVSIHLDQGAKAVSVLTFACHPRIHRKVNLTKDEKLYYGSDVAFVGEVSEGRKKILESITNHQLKIWSRREISSLENGRVAFKPLEESHPLFRAFTGCAAWDEEMVKVYNASKIVLNLHSQGGTSTNMRSFEITGSGGFLLADRRQHLEELFLLGEEYDHFESLEQLNEKISFYLTHENERQKIAERGFQKAHQNHTYRHRLEEIIKKAESLKAEVQDE